MLFPIGDDNIERGHPALFSYGFLALNFAVFMLQMSFPTEYEQRLFVEQYGVIPMEISHGLDMQTLITGIFLHGGWVHLLGNMLYLWIFGDNIEATIGSFRFVLFYLIGGILASLTQVLIEPGSVIPCIGASGAIAAVMGAYTVMFPQSRVKMILLVFFAIFYIPAWVFLGFWFAQQAMSGVESLNIGGETTGGVAWWAHIGGFVYGALVGLFYRGRYKAIA
jgi:membrane associated rhomboid family serine protease